MDAGEPTLVFGRVDGVGEALHLAQNMGLPLTNSPDVAARLSLPGFASSEVGSGGPIGLRSLDDLAIAMPALLMATQSRPTL